MKSNSLLIILFLAYIEFSCSPLEKIAKHDFDSGYFRLKTSDNKYSEIYLDVKEDTITTYQLAGKYKTRVPELSTAQTTKLSEIRPGNILNNSILMRKSIDIDLSTVALKYRPESSGVPNQLSYNVNALLYAGIRRDYFKIKSENTPIKENNTFIRHIGFDAGIFAGIGITPVNPTVTNGKTILEYDGWFFQKGIAAFITIERMSVGVSLGFDNLLDKNSDIWIYNRKPWIGIILGIANF